LASKIKTVEPQKFADTQLSNAGQGAFFAKLFDKVGQEDPMLARVIEKKEGAVRGHTEVSIMASGEELAELKAALLVMQKFKDRALKEAGVMEGDEDWMTTRFEIRHDVCRVRLDYGACG